MQAQLSDQQTALADAGNQLQQQQETSTSLQARLDSEIKDAEAAAAAAAQQLEQGEHAAQQMQQQLTATKEECEALQESCNAQATQIAELGAELSDAVGCAQTMQVGYIFIIY